MYNSPHLKIYINGQFILITTTETVYNLYRNKRIINLLIKLLIKYY